MRISFERSGGFAGMMMTVSIDTAKLGPSEATQVKSMVEAANFFQLPEAIASSAQPDRFQYHLTVAEPQRKHSVTVSESCLPGNLRPLVDWLMDAARHSRSS
ncbi:MAG: protealysin inhibitor emfourin [Leptolyngbyaceae cyanobacterium bins.349]|nr:protealysin inhibitor emfourin [Leptolyngbyaceae cyanobacterium bins.349]